MFQNRKYIIQLIFILIGLVLLIKLFNLQVLSSYYKIKAKHNIIHEMDEYPFRGLIYDRNHKIIVNNKPIYNLMIIPRELHINDTSAFCELLEISDETFIKKYKTSLSYSYVKPSLFLDKIPYKKFAQIQDHLHNYSGLYVTTKMVRSYIYPSLANILGYLGEINFDKLKFNHFNYYQKGDYVGITGIEEYYETQLRGEKGKSIKVINAKGIEKGTYQNGKHDIAAIPGSNLITTIDIDLQSYTEKLLEGKKGSIIAIEPATGEVIVIASSPSYNPNLLTSNNRFSENYLKLLKDDNHPLFNRAIMAEYPAGSVFKTVQALIALDEEVIHVNEKINCNSYHIGDHAPLGVYDIKKGIAVSSNNYFYELMRRLVNRGDEPNVYKNSQIGLDQWAKSVRNFGFGEKTNIDIPGEKTGIVPDTAYYNSIYGKNRWKYSTIASLSIGQGELLVTPIQIANLAVIIANRGYYYPPHVVKSIETHSKIGLIQYEKKYPGKAIDYYDEVIEGMSSSLNETAPKAIIKDIEICGKTGTAENGIKGVTKDHSIFIAFAPKVNPKIAVSAYIENAGWGGGAAAVSASLIIEKYLRGFIDSSQSRYNLNKEAYILDSKYKLDNNQ